MTPKDEIQAWLVERVAELARAGAEDIDIKEPFANFGLSSKHAVLLSGDLEDLTGRTLSPTLLYEYPCIEAVVRYLSEEQTDPSPQEVDGGAVLCEPVAIVGIGCRFPGADDPNAFWELLQSGTNAVTKVPLDRWDAEAFYHPDAHAPGRAITRWGGFLDHVDRFDPFFFGISPGEAECMDPQQRLLMELAYEALEDAGQVVDFLAGKSVGVFVGISGNEYTFLQLDPALISGHSGTGNALSIAANRISYFFDFRGPSVAIDTACSSSLMAVHLACRSIRTGESEIALAGGVNLMLTPALSIAFTKAGAMAPDGLCKAFDARANGYVRGEGGGLVLLKPLARALADGDPVYAVIRGSAANQDGRTNGLMAPSPEAQEAVLRAAYRDAQVPVGDVRYVEAHGTGTLLGDPIEAKALAAVLSADRENSPLTVGSVKTNIGHLEAAAGVAGLIKVALSLKHRAIPPSLHFREPNPHIPFEQYCLRVPTDFEPWPNHTGPAVAGVSAFGFGGSNVHVVVEEVPAREQVKSFEGSDAPDLAQLLPVSAHTSEALLSHARAYRDLLAADRQGEETPSIREICYTAGARRSHHDYRLAAVGRSRNDLVRRLENILRNGPRAAAARRHQKLVFVFPGQGSQWPGMGRELLEQEPVFRATLEACDEAMREHIDWSLLGQFATEELQSPHGDIDIIQPTIFAIQVALTALWRSWGIEPDAVVGHSMGEVAAAHAAGALTLEDAARVICRRSRILSRVSGQGSMAVVELTLERAKGFVTDYEGRLSVAASNSPNFTVLSGESAAMEDAVRALQNDNLFCRPVNVDVASHSRLMDPLLCDVRDSLEGLDPLEASVPMVSTVTGAKGNDLRLDADYWVRNLREPVRFSAAVQQLMETGHDTFIEISTHPILLSSIRDSQIQFGHEAVGLPSLRRDVGERASMLESLGALYVAGHAVDWKRLHPPAGRCVSLPCYPWQRERFWLDAGTASSQTPGQSRSDGNGLQPLLGTCLDLADPPGGLVWQTVIDERLLPFLEDHRVDGEMLVPAAAFMVLAQEAAARAGIKHTHEVTELTLRERLVVRPGVPLQVQTVLLPVADGTMSLRVYSRASGAQEAAWTLHATADFGVPQLVEDLPASDLVALEAIRERCNEQLEPDDFYEAVRESGIDYGPRFRGIEGLWRGSGEAVGRIRLPALLRFETTSYDVHPAFLDACLQVIAATFKGSSPANGLFLPIGCRRFRQGEVRAEAVWSHAVFRSDPESAPNLLEADVRVMDDRGRVIIEILGFTLLRVAPQARLAQLPSDTWLYRTMWRPVEHRSPIRPSQFNGTRWLILGDTAGFGSRLAEHLGEHGASCELFSYADLGGTAVLETIEGSAGSPTLRLRLQELFARTESLLDGVVHLWNLEAPSGSAIGAGTLEAAQALGCQSVVSLIQAIAATGSIGSPRLWLVTRGAQSVDGKAEVALAQAPVWGLGKVIGFELPELRCVRIDLDPTADREEGVELLLGQLLAEDETDDEIAFRHGARFVPRLLPYELAIASRAAFEIARPDSTYLITGGLGGLGLTVARWLADRGAGHLVLLGRTGPTPKAEAALEELRQLGVEVRVAKADVADAVELAEVLSCIERSMPPLKGIVHAAGVLDDGALVNLDADRLTKVMDPKVQGTWNLHSATLETPLDFFVLFSSAVSVLGSPGQGNYAAANAFLDALAHYRHGLGLPAISINWGPWAEIGLAAATGEQLKEQGTAAPHLVKAFSRQNGLRVLEALTQLPLPQMMALPFNLRNLLELYPVAARTARFAEVGGKESHVSRLYARPALRQDYVAPRNNIERRLAGLWRQALHIDRVGIRDSFFELGGDSVLAAQIVTRAQNAFGVEINLEEAFKALTIEQFADMLQRELIAKIDKLSESEVQGLLADDAR